MSTFSTSRNVGQHEGSGQRFGEDAQGIHAEGSQVVLRTERMSEVGNKHWTEKHLIPSQSIMSGLMNRIMSGLMNRIEADAKDDGQTVSKIDSTI